MRRHVALALVTLVVCPQWSHGEEPAPTVAEWTRELHGPQLPAAGDESREVVRLASAVEPTVESDQQALLHNKLAEVDRLQAEVDGLRQATGTPTMLYVKAEVLEVNLTALRKLGVDFASFSNGQLTPEWIATLIDDGMQNLGDAEAAQSFISFLVEKNIAKSLTRPRVMTLSGNPATVHVGGRVPLPAAPGAASLIEYEDFGTRLDVEVEAIGNHRARFNIRPCLREVDESHSILVHGQLAPVLSSTEFNVVGEVALGQAVAYEGLLSVRTEQRKLGWGRVEEVVVETSLMTIVSIEDASKLAATEHVTPTAPAPYGLPYSPPAIR